jgi:hypothetical protein
MVNTKIIKIHCFVKEKYKKAVEKDSTALIIRNLLHLFQQNHFPNFGEVGCAYFVKIYSTR